MSSLQRFLEQLVSLALVVLDLLETLDQYVLILFHLFDHALRFFGLTGKTMPFGEEHEGRGQG